jgi:selenide,water dikinase
VTGASARNWESYGNSVSLPDEHADWQRNVLTDPQTSGGLLVCCSPEETSRVIEVFRNGGFESACRIGKLTSGPAGIDVR